MKLSQESVNWLSWQNMLHLWRNILIFVVVHFTFRYFAYVLAELNFRDALGRDNSLYGDWEAEIGLVRLLLSLMQQHICCSHYWRHQGHSHNQASFLHPSSHLQAFSLELMFFKNLYHRERSHWAGIPRATPHHEYNCSTEDGNCVFNSRVSHSSDTGLCGTEMQLSSSPACTTF